MSAEFDDDGRSILTTGEDGAARLWDATTGQGKLLWSGSPRGLTLGRFLPGHRALVAGPGGLWVLALADGSVEFSAPDVDAVAADVSARGDAVGVLDVGGVLHVWDLPAGALRFVRQTKTRGLASAIFTPDGERIVTSDTENDRIWLWDSRTGEPAGEWRGHGTRLTPRSFTPDGRFLVTPVGEKDAVITQIASGQTVVTLEGHTSDVTSASFNTDGARVVTTSTDRTARVWDATTGRVLLSLIGGASTLSEAEFSSSGDRIVVHGEDETARLFDARTGRLVFPLQGPARVRASHFDRKGDRLLTAIEDGTARIWSTADPSQRRVLDAGDEGIVEAEFIDAKHLYTMPASEDRFVEWDVSTAEARSGPRLGKILVNSLDGWVVGVADNDGIALVTADARRLSRVSVSPSKMSHSDFIGHDVFFNIDPDDPMTGLFFDVATGARRGSIALSSEVYDATADRAGKRLALGLKDGTILVVDSSGATLARLHAPGAVVLVTFDHGHSLATLTKDRSIQIWDLSTGKMRIAIPALASTRFIRFSADDRLLVTMDTAEVSLLDVATGDKLASFQVGIRLFAGASFSPDGQWLAISRSHRAVEVVDVHVDP
jgi:WD40 repeat protein